MTKLELFETELQKSALIFKALGHPARLAILKYLAEAKVCISGDISLHLPLSRTTVNQHLTVLKKADLIKGSISGIKVNYCLNVEKMEKIKPLLDSYFDLFKSCHNNEC